MELEQSARAQIRDTRAGAGEDEELLLNEQILGNQGLGTARTDEPGDGGQKVDQE